MESFRFFPSPGGSQEQTAPGECPRASTPRLELRLYDGFPFKRLLPETSDPLRPPPPPEPTPDPLLDKTSAEYRARAEEMLDEMEVRLARLTRLRDKARERYLMYLEMAEQAQWNLDYVSPSYAVVDRPSLAEGGKLVGEADACALARYVKSLKKLRDEAGGELQNCAYQVDRQTRAVTAAAREILRARHEPTYTRMRACWRQAMMDRFDGGVLDCWSGQGSEAASWVGSDDCSSCGGCQAGDGSCDGSSDGSSCDVEDKPDGADKGEEKSESLSGSHVDVEPPSYYAGDCLRGCHCHLGLSRPSSPGMVTSPRSSQDYAGDGPYSQTNLTGATASTDSLGSDPCAATDPSAMSSFSSVIPPRSEPTLSAGSGSSAGGDAGSSSGSSTRTALFGGAEGAVGSEAAEAA